MQKWMALIFFSALLAGCSSTAPVITAAPSPLPFVTATLVPTFTLAPTHTPAPPTITPTIAPVTGSLTTQVNVRAAPNAGAQSLGLLDYGTQVQVIGKDSAGKWLMIVYPENSSSAAWVVKDYVQLDSALIDSLRVMQADLPATVQPANAETPTLAPRTALVSKTINVRAGPATSFDALGTISAGTTVVLTGRNQIDTWIQIEYTSGPNGRGWVAAAYVEAANLQGLAYFDNQGQLVFAPTDAAPVTPGQPTAGPTTVPAAAGDGDSEEKPAVSLEFSPAGAQSLTYSSDLSSPAGDDVDWVAFVPYVPAEEAGYVYMKLACTGNGGVTATLEKDGHTVSESPQLVCGNYGLAMKVLGGQTYMLVLRADGSGGPLRYVSYTLTISLNP